jgi:hypothetical protein
MILDPEHLSGGPDRARGWPLAARMAHIERFHVMRIMARADALAAEGRPVTNMVIGEPDIVSAEPIIQGGVAALQAGRTRYAPDLGLPPARGDRALVRPGRPGRPGARAVRARRRVAGRTDPRSRAALSQRDARAVDLPARQHRAGAGGPIGTVGGAHFAAGAARVNSPDERPQAIPPITGVDGIIASQYRATRRAR